MAFKVINFHENLYSSGGVPWMNLIYDLIILELFNKGI